ncbi:hypothetical protein HN51_052500, partial [Arachis hypogaea]
STFSLKNVSKASTSKSIEKPLFKPFKMSSRAKQSLKTTILKQQSSDSEVIQKIDQLLNHFTTVPENPTNSGESTSRIQTRSSKAINALGHDSSEYSSDQSDDSDGKTKYNIMSMLQHMTMVGTAYQAAHETSEEAIANIIISGCSGQLKGWWDNYLSDNQKHSIFSAIKVNDQNEPIIGDDGEPIPDAVNTLIFTIASHFIGDPSFWKDRSAELLSNLRLKRKINNLNLDPQIEDHINNLLIESSDDESGRESSDDINNIQVDDIESSSDSDVKQISVLSKDQDLLFDAIEAIGDPEQKENFLLKLKSSLQKEKKPKNLVLSNKYDVKPIFQKLEKQVIRPITIQDLQTEVNNLKREIQEIKRNQDNHQLILSQLMQEEETGDEELDPLINQTEFSTKQENEASNDNEGNEILRIIIVFSFMKDRVHIRIVVKDFVLETIALFDSGADSNCIKEGLIPTKYFENTTERLS